MQLEEDLRAGFPDELLPDPSPAFTRAEFMIGNPFHGGVVGYQEQNDNIDYSVLELHQVNPC
jgi:hypothetical protein